MHQAASIERRTGGELRVAGTRLVGLAVPYGSPSADLGGFTEVIRPGAFRRALAEGADVLALHHHDTRAVLGRTSAGTLSLWEEPQGVAFQLDVAQTSAGRDVLESVGRGDVRGMSFGFIARKDAWPSADRREIVDADLLEITVTAIPAYAATAVARRTQPVAAWRLALAERALELRRAVR
jgi:HK97 family phage prohead protease